MRASQVTRSTRRLTGAYSAMTRSRSSYDLRGRALSRNTHREPRKTYRLIFDAMARGMTTVRTAEPMAAAARSMPAAKTTIRTAITLASPYFGRRGASLRQAQARGQAGPDVKTNVPVLRLAPGQRLRPAVATRNSGSGPSSGEALPRVGAGGGRGIRTPEALAGLAVFKTAPFVRSGIPPRRVYPRAATRPTPCRCWARSRQ